MIKTNYHTHTKYCDGKNTAREMIEAAIGKGFKAIGFSGHSHTSFDESYCMSLKASLDYRKEIAALREEYSDKIEVYCGMEYDYYADDVTDGLDYLIGSVHYVYKDGQYFPVDWSEDVTFSIVKYHYDDDLYAFCEDYFRTVADVVDRTGCDIVGHFDLVTKFNEDFARTVKESPELGYEKYIIDETDPRYVAAYRAALEAINSSERAGAACGNSRALKLYGNGGNGAILEINTGAMSNGRRSVPYPSLEILKYHRELGGSITISSDSHKVDTLDCGFEAAAALAREAGYDKVMALLDGAFQEVKLD